jgi:hypothetical protein
MCGAQQQHRVFTPLQQQLDTQALMPLAWLRQGDNKGKELEGCERKLLQHAREAHRSAVSGEEETRNPSTRTTHTPRMQLPRRTKRETPLRPRCAHASPPPLFTPHLVTPPLHDAHQRVHGAAHAHAACTALCTGLCTR